MLFPRDVLQGIAEGLVTVASRRWRKPPPADGSTLRTPVGVVRLERVTVVDEGDITPEDVRRTGLSADALRLIAEHPATLARRSAVHLRSELLPFTRRVRQLKELGLTGSLEVGYRLALRGRDGLPRVAVSVDL